MFQTIDSMDGRGFVNYLTPDATFRFGSNPPIAGRDAIGQAVDAFWGTISGSHHALRRTWVHPEAVIVEGEVTYTRHDGSRVAVPFVDVLGLRESLISEYLIYIDMAPLYAPRSGRSED
jgi:hypothetical protein